MAPIIIKLIGAAIGAVISDQVSKKLTPAKNESIKKIPEAKTGPESNDSQKPSSEGGGRSRKRPDRNASDKPDESTETTGVDHEPDQ